MNIPRNNLTIKCIFPFGMVFMYTPVIILPWFRIR
ncbi:putative membrane protein [Enterobacter sp. J49]|nr:putative membrane protein [Enterobacter sp. J49]